MDKTVDHENRLASGARMAKKRQRTRAQKRDEDQRATTDDLATLDEGDGSNAAEGSRAAAHHVAGDGTELQVQDGGPRRAPDALPGVLRPDLAPDVTARLAERQVLDRKVLDAQVAEHTDFTQLKDPLGNAITPHHGPGVDEMLAGAGKHGLGKPGLEDYLPTPSKGAAPPVSPLHDPSLVGLGEYVPPPGDKEKKEKEQKAEQDKRNEREEQAEARKRFEKRQYEEPKKMTDGESGSNAIFPVSLQDAQDLMNKGDRISHPVQDDGSGAETPTLVADPFRRRGGVMPGVVDRDPDYVEVQIQGPPRVPGDGLTDFGNPDDFPPTLPTGGVRPPTGNDGDPQGEGMTAAQANEPVASERGDVPIASEVGHDVPGAFDPGAAVAPEGSGGAVAPEAAVAHGVAGAFDAGDAPAFDADGDLPAPSVDVHADFDSPQPDAQYEPGDAGASGDFDNDDGS
jgi:hypothetical protein